MAGVDPVLRRRLPEAEGSRGALPEGQQDGKGYAPSSASIPPAAAVVGLRERGVTVSGDDQTEARAALEGLAVKLLKTGERPTRRRAHPRPVHRQPVMATARAPVERGMARLKSWQIFRASRVSPNRVTIIIKAVLTLERQH